MIENFHGTGLFEFASYEYGTTFRVIVCQDDQPVNAICPTSTILQRFWPSGAHRFLGDIVKTGGDP